MKNMKKNLGNPLCVFLAMAVALFWFAMCASWSGISKVLYEAMGKTEPTDFPLNLPLYVSIFLWVLFAFAVVNLVRKGNKKKSTIALVALLGIFTVASIVVVVMGAIDYLYFILPKFFVSMLVSLCIAAFAWLLFFPPVKNGKFSVVVKCAVVALHLLTCIPGMIGAYFYAKYIGKKEKANDEADSGEIVQTYEELVASYGTLPSGTMSLAPIVVPIMLMAMSNVSSILGWTGALNTACVFLGTPIISLAVGVVLGIVLLNSSKMVDKLYDLTNDTLKTVGPILFVTAAGGVLAKIISSTSPVSFITENADVLQSIGIFFPFLLAAILKSAQGSSTVAITTTAGIMALLGMDTTIMAVLCVMAIGAGAMTVSHANDSYFWGVTNFGGMTPDRGYKTQTMTTLVQGVCSILFIFVLTLIFG